MLAQKHQQMLKRDTYILAGSLLLVQRKAIEGQRDGWTLERVIHVRDNDIYSTTSEL